MDIVRVTDDSSNRDWMTGQPFGIIAAANGEPLAAFRLDMDSETEAVITIEASKLPGARSASIMAARFTEAWVQLQGASFTLRVNRKENIYQWMLEEGFLEPEYVRLVRASKPARKKKRGKTDDRREREEDPSTPPPDAPQGGGEGEPTPEGVPG